MHHADRGSGGVARHPLHATLSPYFNPWIDTLLFWNRKLSRENFNLSYLPKIFPAKQIARAIWRVKLIDRSRRNRCGSFHINWRSFHANMLTEGVTNMPSWVVITAICKFCDTSPLSLWKRRSRLHRTFWKLYVILHALSSQIGIRDFPIVRLMRVINRDEILWHL